MGWIFAILAGIGGVTFIARGVYLLFADEYICAQVSISFDHIGSRLGTIGLNCLPPTSNGAIPSWLAGWGAIIAGLILLLIALIAAAAAFND